MSDEPQPTDTPSISALGEIRDRLKKIMRRYGRGNLIGPDLASLYAEIEVSLARRRWRASRNRQAVREGLSALPYVATPDELPEDFGI